MLKRKRGCDCYVCLLIQAADFTMSCGQYATRTHALLGQALRVWSLPGLNSPEYHSVSPSGGQGNKAAQFGGWRRTNVLSLPYSDFQPTHFSAPIFIPASKSPHASKF